MKFFRDMDLYKGIILISVVLLPVGYWWITTLEDQIQASQAALNNATRPRGYLEQVGSLQGKIALVEQNRRIQSDVISEPRNYFEQQILAVNSTLKPNDFTPREGNPEPATLPTKQRVVDHVVNIDWGSGRDKKAYPLDFVYAVIFNCESGALRNGQVTASPSVWRLRTLKLENATNATALRTHKVPPPELQDSWHIATMQFARREPAAGR